MTAYAELLPDILPHVASCPVPTITRALQIVGQDFFQRSEAHRYNITPTTLNVGVENVSVTIPAGTRIVCPLTMYCDGERLATTNEDILAMDYGDWRSLSAAPRFVMTNDTVANGLVVALPPNQTYTLTGRIALKPTRAATEIDDEMFELYGDALLDGVLQRLLMMKNTEWYDPNLASYYQNEFERAIDEAHGVSNKANTSRVVSTGYGGL